MTKYIAYCRKSTDEKEKQVLSIDQQISELKEFAQRENLEIVEFLTEAQSAKIPGRPIFNSLTKRIESGEISGIVSWNPDRLARNSVDGGKVIYLLDLGKLQSLKFPTHWFENTPQGRFMLSIAFGQAKYYVDNLSQNVLRGLKYKVKQGIWPARAPMGYRNDRNTHGIVIHPHEAKVIKGAFELYATGKYALIDIGKYFFENGIKNKISGEYPNDSNLRRILMRPLYYGAMIFKGELHEGIHEPIVSKSLFDQVQKTIAHRGWYHQTKSKRYDFAFTGFIKCGYCNCSITAENRPFYFPRTQHSVSYRYYHCTKKKLPCLAKGYTREEVIEEQFRDMIQSISLSETEGTKMLEYLEVDEKTEKQNATIELQKLNLELTETEQKLDRLLEAYLDALVDAEHYKNKKNELMEIQSRLKDKINQQKIGNPFWVESMKEFVFCAQECAKIARAENNGHLLSQMAKKVGSKYFLKDHRIAYSLLPPYAALAASAGAASADAPSDRILAFGQSKYYVDNLSENVRRGQRQKLRNGVYPFKAPFGYVNNPKTRGIDVDPATSKIAQEMFSMFVQKNCSFTAITQHLKNTYGLTKKNGKHWHIDTIKHHLSNKFYTGVITMNDEYYEGTHETFISKELFAEAQKQIKRISRPQKQGHNFAFSGLARCGSCGAAITAETHTKHYPRTGRTMTYNYYRCTRKLKPCDERPVTELEVENQLRQILESVSLPQSWANQWSKWVDRDEIQEKGSAETMIQKLKQELADIDRKANILLDSYLDQIVDTETFKQKKNQFFEEKMKLQETIGKLEAGGLSWIEPMREFIKTASECEKIARAKNNCEDVGIFAKRVGSNFFLSDRRLTPKFRQGFAAVSSRPGREALENVATTDSFRVGEHRHERAKLSIAVGIVLRLV